MQYALQIVVQSFVQKVYRKLAAMQKRFAEMSCRNGLQKPRRWQSEPEAAATG